MGRYSIVIPNYNGAGFFPRYLPSVVEFAKSGGMELIIVDDASGDDSVALLARDFPEAIVLTNEENLGFGETVNRGVKSATGELVFLFNTDILIRSISLEIVEEYAGEPDFFGLTFKSLNPDDLGFREGAKRLVYRSGLPTTLHNPGDQVKDAQGRWLSFYPVGGHAVVNRERFLELGGFADCYSPFYWEDADLGMQAQLRGWKSWYDERLEVVHDHQGSIKTNNQKKYIDYIKLRNRFIFLLRNTTPGERMRLYPMLTVRMLENLLKGRLDFFRAWSEAKARARSGNRAGAGASAGGSS